MLLSLQREVQSLKFLNGGAISDLVSRVSVLERNSVKYPNYKTIVKEWKFGMNGDLGDILPGYQGEFMYGQQYSIPSDGYLFFECAANSFEQTLTKKVGFGWQINGRTLGSISASNYETYEYDENSTGAFVKAGDLFRFITTVTAAAGTRNPNAGGNYARVYLFAGQ